VIVAALAVSGLLAALVVRSLVSRRSDEVPASTSTTTSTTTTTSTIATPTPEPASCAVYAPDGIPDVPARRRLTSEWLDGARGFRRAMEEGESAAAPVLALFFTTWCPYCKRFDAEVVPSREVADLPVVKVKVNAEGDADDRELARKYGVHSYPSVLLFRPDRTGPVPVSAVPSPRAFADACARQLPDPAREHLERGASLGKAGSAAEAVKELKAAAAEPRLAPLALDHLGVLALNATCYARAEAVFSRALELAPSDEGGRLHYLRGLARFRGGEPARALADADAACRLGHREGCGVAERARAAGAR
jgi:thiol-disulfide isomerase/thioredoxin